MAKKNEKKLTIERSVADFKLAYQAKRKLIEREKSDFLFALGEQWSDEDKEKMRASGITPVTDNRIQPNLFLLTGLERQNRADFKAFPQGEEDGLKAEIASALFKDAIRKSGYSYKSSEQFKDGVTCGESHLELYLDNTESLTNGKPCWQKIDGNSIFPDPATREYDFSDSRYVYKVKLDIAKGDLISLFPDAKKLIEKANSGKLDYTNLLKSEGTHLQKRDYSKSGDNEGTDEAHEESFDLIERYYKKWVERVFVGDYKSGEVKEAEDLETAENFVNEYRAGIENDKQLHAQAVERVAAQSAMTPGVPVEQPPAPPEQNPDRFIVIKRMVPEIWCFAHVPGIEEPLADKRAWFYPKWKQYPFIPYFARFSTAPLEGDERHLLVQGVVHGVKGAQEKHNKAEMLMLRHLNTSANSGWLSEEDSWVDQNKVKKFGTAAGVDLEYRTGKPKPERITPSPLSQAHAQIALDSAESIKAQLGINADLLAANESGGDSGRAIALRQKQGLLMVQELFDNHSRSKQIAGRFLLSQLGEIYDTETAIKVLGEAFMRKNFAPPMVANPEDPMSELVPMTDEYGKPMQYDKEMAELAIAEVLSGNLEEYDVSVGESVASETQRLANSAELTEIAKTYPGIIPPKVLIKNSQLPESVKAEILAAIQQAEEMAAQAAQTPKPGPKETR